MPNLSHYSIALHARIIHIIVKKFVYVQYCIMYLEDFKFTCQVCQNKILDMAIPFKKVVSVLSVEIEFENCVQYNNLKKMQNI